MTNVIDINSHKLDRIWDVLHEKLWKTAHDFIAEKNDPMFRELQAAFAMSMCARDLIVAFQEDLYVKEACVGEKLRTMEACERLFKDGASEIIESEFLSEGGNDDAA